MTELSLEMLRTELKAELAPIRAQLDGLPLISRSIEVLHRDVRSLPAALNDLAPGNVTPGEIEALHADVDRLRGDLGRACDPHRHSGTIEPGTPVADDRLTLYRPARVPGQHQAGAVEHAGEPASAPQPGGRGWRPREVRKRVQPPRIHRDFWPCQKVKS
jgi:hypothetical protein